MKKLFIIIVLSTIFTACKTAKKHCDAYGSIENYDIYDTHVESQKKYSNVVVIK